MAKFVDTKTKQRHCYSVAIAKAIDMNSYHVSVMDIDTMETQQGQIFIDITESTKNELALAIGRSVLNLMRFKV